MTTQDQSLSEGPGIEAPPLQSVLLDDGLKLAYRELGDGPAGAAPSRLADLVVPVAPGDASDRAQQPRRGRRPARLRRVGQAAWGDATTSTSSSARSTASSTALGIEEVAIAVHDLGGPVGVHWALGRPHRVTKLALLNTLLYPEFSEAVQQFVTACSTPGMREQLTSPAGLEAAMRLGVADDSMLSPEVIAAVQEPFQSDDDRRALADAGIGRRDRGLRRDSAATAFARRPGPHHLRREGPHPARRRRDDGESRSRRRRGGCHQHPGLRALPPGGVAGGDRGAAGRVLRRADRYVGGAAITSTT